jgi:hypothetical protein
MTRLFPFWREILAEAGYRIGVTIPLRHPLEVAASLRARNAMPVAQGLLMWLGGMLDAELQSRGYPRRLLPWADFLRDWRPVLDAAAQSLEIAWPISPDEARSRINTFLDAGLRHQVLREEDLRAEPAANIWIRDVYAAMTRLVSDPGSVEAMTELDRVRLEFTDATRLFGPNLDRLEQHGKQVATGAEALRAAVADREAKLAVAQAESDVTSARVAELGQRLSRAHDDVERLTAATAEQACQAGELASALSDSEAGRARGESRAAVSEARVRELEAHAAAREAIVADLRGQLDRPWRTALRLTLPARALAVVRWIRHR